MLRYFVLLISVVSISDAGYVDGHAGNDIGNGGNSYGYGYSGSYSGSGPPPNFGIPNFGNFQAFLNNYLGSLAKYHEEFMRNGGGSAAFSYASSSPSAKAEASSSVVVDNRNGIQTAATQGQVGGFSGGGGGYGGSVGIGNRGAFGGSFANPQTSVPVAGHAAGGGGSYGAGFGTGAGGGGSYGVGFGPGAGGAFGGSFSGPGTGGVSFSAPPDNGASASAFYGPGGVHQTASVYPENVAAPNINTRFAAAPANGDGFYSVFTSSQSQTSNLNGKPLTVNRATTTVNDNGKITTYTAKNP